ncbi:MAG: hypothetical protein AAB460_00390 [Patescibacteria group bacterium]
MHQKDPLQDAEDLIREIHDAVGKHTQPVLSRYPLTFSFLLVFGFAAILHGFELVTEHMPIFDRHPWLLLVIGILVLLFTGSLYRVLEKNH